MVYDLVMKHMEGKTIVKMTTLCVHHVTKTGNFNGRVTNYIKRTILIRIQYVIFAVILR